VKQTTTGAAETSGLTGTPSGARAGRRASWVDLRKLDRHRLLLDALDDVGRAELVVEHRELAQPAALLGSDRAWA
jgi:hypothetical protein